ncbi:MAG: hypothetical protein IKN42_01360, partial [Elusimicrobia bacterium]|nr:hypothetical protein [Elusimicrobiota bacterium]
YGTIAEQTGKSKAEVRSYFEGVRSEMAETGQTETFDRSMGVLQGILENGGKVVNCATEATKNILVSTGTFGVRDVAKLSGDIALSLLGRDIESGAFLSNNNRESDQVMISMEAVKEELNARGVTGYEGYAVNNIEGLKEGLSSGNSVILHIEGSGENTGHFITIDKNEKGQITIKDPNQKDKVLKTEEEMEGYLKETYGWTGGALLSKTEISLGSIIENLSNIFGSRLVIDDKGKDTVASPSKTTPTKQTDTGTGNKSNSGNSGGFFSKIKNTINNVVNKVVNTAKTILSGNSNNNNNSNGGNIFSRIGTAIAGVFGGGTTNNINSNSSKTGTNNTGTNNIFSNIFNGVSNIFSNVGTVLNNIANNTSNSFVSSVFGGLAGIASGIGNKIGAIGNSGYTNCAANAVANVTGMGNFTWLAQIALNITDLLLGNGSVVANGGNSLQATGKMLEASGYNAYEVNGDQLELGLQNGSVILYVASGDSGTAEDHLITIIPQEDGKFVIEDGNFVTKDSYTMDESQAQLGKRYGWTGGIMFAQEEEGKKVGGERIDLSDEDHRGLTAKATDENAEANRGRVLALADAGVVFVDTNGDEMSLGDIDLRTIPEGVLPGLEEVTDTMKDPNTGRVREGFTVTYGVGGRTVDISNTNGTRATIELADTRGNTKEGLGVVTEVTAELLTKGKNNPRVTYDNGKVTLTYKGEDNRDKTATINIPNGSGDNLDIVVDAAVELVDRGVNKPVLTYDGGNLTITYKENYQDKTATIDLMSGINSNNIGTVLDVAMGLLSRGVNNPTIAYDKNNNLAVSYQDADREKTITIDLSNNVAGIGNLDIVLDVTVVLLNKGTDNITVSYSAGNVILTYKDGEQERKSTIQIPNGTENIDHLDIALDASLEFFNKGINDSTVIYNGNNIVLSYKEGEEERKAVIEILNDQGKVRQNLNIVLDITIELLQMGVKDPVVTDKQAERIAAEEKSGVRSEGARLEVKRDCITLSLENLIGTDLSDNSVVEDVLNGTRTYNDVATEIVTTRCKELGIIPDDDSTTTTSETNADAEQQDNVQPTDRSIVDRIVSGEITLKDAVIETLRGKEELSGIDQDDEESWNGMADTVLDIGKGGIDRVISDYERFKTTKAGLEPALGEKLGDRYGYRDGQFGVMYETQNNGTTFIGASMFGSLSLSEPGSSLYGEEGGHLIVTLDYGRTIDLDQAKVEDGKGLVYYYNGEQRILNKNISMQQLGEDLSLAYSVAQDMLSTNGNKTPQVYIAWDGEGVMIADGHENTMLVSSDSFRGQQALRRTINNSLGDGVCNWDPARGQWVIKYKNAPTRYLSTVYRKEITTFGYTATDFVNMQRYINELQEQGITVSYADGTGVYTTTNTVIGQKLYDVLCGKSPSFTSVEKYVEYQKLMKRLMQGLQDTNHTIKVTGYLGDGVWTTLVSNGVEYNIDDILNWKSTSENADNKAIGGTASENLEWFINTMYFVKQNNVSIDSNTDWRYVPEAVEYYASTYQESSILVFGEDYSGDFLKYLKENKGGNPIALATTFWDEKYGDLISTKAEAGELGITLQKRDDGSIDWEATLKGKVSEDFLPDFTSDGHNNQYKYEMLVALGVVAEGRGIELSAVTKEDVKTYCYDQMFTDGQYNGTSAHEVFFGGDTISNTKAEVVKDLIFKVLGGDDAINQIVQSATKDKTEGTDTEDSESNNSVAETQTKTDVTEEDLFQQVLTEEYLGITTAMGYAEKEGWSVYTMDVNYTIASWRTRTVKGSEFIEDGKYVQTIRADGKHSFSQGGGCPIGNGTVIYGVTGDHIKNITDIGAKNKDERIDFRSLVWEFEETPNSWGITYSVKVNGINNAYIADDTKIKQYKSNKSGGTSTGTSDGKTSQTRGVITEEDDYYEVSGTGSRVTFTLSSGGKAEALVIGNGTQALAGSRLRVDSKNKETEFTVKSGHMTYWDGAWSTTGSASVFRYDHPGYMENEVKKYVAKNIIGDENNWEEYWSTNFSLADIDMKGTAGSVLSAVESYNASGQEIIFTAKGNTENPATIKAPEGLVDIDNGTQFKLDITGSGALGFKYKGESIDSTIDVDVKITDTNHYTLILNGAEVSGFHVTFKDGEFVNFWSAIDKYNSMNTSTETQENDTENSSGEENIERSSDIPALYVQTNFSFTLKDSNGTTTTIGKYLKLTGNANGEMVLAENLDVNFKTDAGQTIRVNDGTGSRAYWNAGSVINLSFVKGQLKDVVISGDFTVEKIYIKDKSDSSDDSSGQSGVSGGVSPTFKGTVHDKGSNLFIDSGTFRNVSSDKLSSGVSATTVYANNSEIDAGSYLLGQDVKEDSVMYNGQLVSKQALSVSPYQNLSMLNDSIQMLKALNIDLGTIPTDMTLEQYINSGASGAEYFRLAAQAVENLTGISVLAWGADKALTFAYMLTGQTEMTDKNLKDLGFDQVDGSENEWEKDGVIITRNEVNDGDAEGSNGAIIYNSKAHMSYNTETGTHISNLGSDGRIVAGQSEITIRITVGGKPCEYHGLASNVFKTNNYSYKEIDNILEGQGIQNPITKGKLKFNYGDNDVITFDIAVDPKNINIKTNTNYEFSVFTLDNTRVKDNTVSIKQSGAYLDITGFSVEGDIPNITKINVIEGATIQYSKSQGGITYQYSVKTKEFSLSNISQETVDDIFKIENILKEENIDRKTASMVANIQINENISLMTSNIIGDVTNFKGDLTEFSVNLNGDTSNNTVVITEKIGDLTAITAYILGADISNLRRVNDNWEGPIYTTESSMVQMSTVKDNITYTYSAELNSIMNLNDLMDDSEQPVTKLFKNVKEDTVSVTASIEVSENIHIMTSSVDLKGVKFDADRGGLVIEDGFEA